MNACTFLKATRSLLHDHQLYLCLIELMGQGKAQTFKGPVKFIEAGDRCKMHGDDRNAFFHVFKYIWEQGLWNINLFVRYREHGINAFFKHDTMGL